MTHQWRLASAETMPADDMPEEIIERLRTFDHGKTIALFVFAPELQRLTDADHGVTRSEWFCAALIVYRGKLSHNKLVIGIAEQIDGDSIDAVAGSFAGYVGGIVEAALGVRDE